VEKLLKAVKELLRLLDSNPCAQYSGEGEFRHEHILFDNIDRDRIENVCALVEAAEQSIHHMRLTPRQKKKSSKLSYAHCQRVLCK
jgi:hypothetical protein